MNGVNRDFPHGGNIEREHQYYIYVTVSNVGSHRRSNPFRVITFLEQQIFVDKVRSRLYNKEASVNNASRWSSGQDVALSRRSQGFDSPTGYQEKPLKFSLFNGFITRLYLQHLAEMTMI